jgi:hypothetical protein
VILPLPTYDRTKAARFATLRNGHRNGVNADIAAGLILAIDGVLRDAPARGTTMTTDTHIDTLLDLSASSEYSL